MICDFDLCQKKSVISQNTGSDELETSEWVLLCEVAGVELRWPVSKLSGNITAGKGKGRADGLMANRSVSAS